ncbi:transcriptional regulatory protein EmbR_1 [Mycobacterium marinum M]|uniref:Transcriptional regulatory protein EmbR_1 n=1 Tax=Mycobacterium marinum (strain ATCC BAA-535 / M) TaxID=216594 RepID=B2HK20_MYCMM|nr:BTAD domain-containing putative transcriptional regulator [Mycobacterium marinum]ACC41962.1 transcriptional regulatory protein EmbR_1 [Mycobacterium marinum M]
MLNFGALGPLEMTIDGVAVPLGTPKQRAVLAALLINRNRPVAIDALIEAAWEQGAPAGARETLYAYVSKLRRLMAGAGIETRELLANMPPGYRLTVADGDYDLGRFVTEKNAGVRAAAASGFEQASDHFSAALAQWRGPVLDDLRDFTFLDAFATGLAEEKLVTQIARAEVEIACGRAQSVTGELEGLTTDHPYREPLWVQLITAYYLAERQSDALDAYRRLRDRLADDLGVDPAPTVRALYGRILRQRPLDVCKTAQANADETISTLSVHMPAIPDATHGPSLRDANERRYPLVATTTRIGRSPDNDIVLSGGKVSRHHAAIVDTGSSFVIVDLRSLNGVSVSGRRVHTSTALTEGDRIRIAEHQLMFETASGADRVS